VPRIPYAGEFLWTAASNRYAWKSLLNEPPGGDSVSPLLAAAGGAAQNLAGLPPGLHSGGRTSIYFVEEDIEYARRLIHARGRGPRSCNVYPGRISRLPVGAGRPRVTLQADSRRLDPRLRNAPGAALKDAFPMSTAFPTRHCRRRRRRIAP